MDNQLAIVKRMTLDGLKQTIRHYKGSQDVSERLLRFRCSCELLRRNALIASIRG